MDERGENEYAVYSPNEESEKRLGGGSGGDENPGLRSDGKEDVGLEHGTAVEAEVGGGVAQRTDSSNILDDMERFQREIDELRVKFKQAG